MKLKRIVEAEEATVTPTSTVGRAQNGIFYVSNGTTWTPVPPSIQKELEFEYRAQQRYKKAQDLGIDLKDAVSKDEKRYKLKDKMDIQAIEEREQKQVAASYVQMAKDQEEEEIRRKEVEEARIRSSSDIDYLKDRLAKEIHEFLDNQLYEEPEDRYDYSWDEQDPYEKLDPDIFNQNFMPVYDDNPIEDDQEKEKPLALFYFDRSGSFKESTHPQKTQLGKDLITMFESDFRDELTMKYIYFSDNIYNKASEAEKHDSTAYLPVFSDIKTKTAGKLANIIILTDQDATRKSLPMLDINGSVWLVFAGSYDGGNLARHIHLLNKESKVKQFYFEKIK